jgi:hypothetical protein
MIYPTIAQINAAGFECLQNWCQELPAPQTDVERTAFRRIAKRRDELFRPALEEQAPDIARQMDDLIAKLRKVVNQ